MLTITTSHRPRHLEMLLLAALAFVLLDGITTSYALTMLSDPREANPIIASIINTFGIIPTMLLKILIGGVVAHFLAHCAQFGYPFSWMQRDWRFRRVPRANTRRRGLVMLSLLAVLHLIVSVNNLIVIVVAS